MITIFSLPSSDSEARQLARATSTSDCGFLRTGGELLATAGRENIRIWRRRGTKLSFAPAILSGLGRGVTFTCATWRGETLLTGNDVGQVFEISGFDFRLLAVHKIGDSSVFSIRAFDGRIAAVCDDGRLRLWPSDFASSPICSRLDAPPLALDLSASGRVVAVTRHAVFALDPSSAECRALLGGPATATTRLVSEARRVAAFCEEALRIFDRPGLHNIDLSLEGKCCTAAALLGNDRLLAGFACGTVAVFELGDARRRRAAPLFDRPVAAVWAKPGTTVFVACDVGGRVVVASTEELTALRQLNAPTGQNTVSNPDGKSSRPPVAAAFDPHVDEFALSFAELGAVGVYSLEDLQPRAKYPTSCTVTRLVYNRFACGELAAIAGDSIRFFSSAPYQPLPSSHRPHPDATPLDLVYLDWNLVVSSADNGSIAVWRTDQPGNLKVVAFGNSPVESLVYSVEMKTLFASSRDGLVAFDIKIQTLAPNPQVLLDKGASEVTPDFAQPPGYPKEILNEQAVENLTKEIPLSSKSRKKIKSSKVLEETEGQKVEKYCLREKLLQVGAPDKIHNKTHCPSSNLRTWVGGSVPKLSELGETSRLSLGQVAGPSVVGRSSLLWEDNNLIYLSENKLIIETLGSRTQRILHFPALLTSVSISLDRRFLLLTSTGIGLFFRVCRTTLRFSRLEISALAALEAEETVALVTSRRILLRRGDDTVGDESLPGDFVDAGCVGVDCKGLFEVITESHLASVVFEAGRGVSQRSIAVAKGVELSCVGVSVSPQGIVALVGCSDGSVLLYTAETKIPTLKSLMSRTALCGVELRRLRNSGKGFVVVDGEGGYHSLRVRTGRLETRRLSVSTPPPADFACNGKKIIAICGDAELVVASPVEGIKLVSGPWAGNQAAELLNLRGDVPMLCVLGQNGEVSFFSEDRLVCLATLEPPFAAAGVCGLAGGERLAFFSARLEFAVVDPKRGLALSPQVFEFPIEQMEMETDSVVQVAGLGARRLIVLTKTGRFFVADPSTLEIEEVEIMSDDHRPSTFSIGNNELVASASRDLRVEVFDVASRKSLAVTEVKFGTQKPDASRPMLTHFGRGTRLLLAVAGSIKISEFMSESLELIRTFELGSPITCMVGGPKAFVVGGEKGKLAFGDLRGKLEFSALHLCGQPESMVFDEQGEQLFVTNGPVLCRYSVEKSKW